MLEKHHGYVVVGAGQAGGRAVETLRARGFEGRIRLIGAESWPPYERPPLSKKFLLDGMQAEALFLQPDTAGAETTVEMMLGKAATAIDRAKRHVRLADGDVVPYDRLLLATGARACRLPLPGCQLAGVHYLRTIEDAISIRSSIGAGAAVVVIGGGYVGLEVAAAARRRGAGVTVVEARETVLCRVLPPLLGRLFERLHRAHGVALQTQVGITGFEGERRLSAVRLSDGRRLPADLAVVGVGAQPNTELAVEAGLAVDDGILTDEFGRTADPHIFAAGDVTRHWNPLLGRRLRLESWQNAQNQAIAVAAAMCRSTKPYAEIPWFWSDQYDVNLQIVGLPAGYDDVILRQADGDYRLSAFFLAAGRLVAAVALNQPRDIGPARRLIEQGRPVDRRRLADASFPLRELLKSPTPL